jgi:non-ribosomal peptide synthetase component F
VNELFWMKNRDLSLDTATSNRSLWAGFLESSARFPNRGAIEIAGHEVSYQQLAQRAKRLAATLQEAGGHGAVPLTGIFAYRSETAYAGVLGALMAGHGYVPLNRTFPVDRTRSMLQRSMCRSLVVDQGSEPQLSAFLPGIDEPLVVLLPDRSDVRDLATKFPGHRILGADDFLAADDWHATDISGNSIAYLLFTSGSTGQPKGVMISHSNVLHYVRYVTERYQFTSKDRFSQLFDLTFDLSADNGAGESGASDCCGRGPVWPERLG